MSFSSFSFNSPQELEESLGKISDAAVREKYRDAILSGRVQPKNDNGERFERDILAPLFRLNTPEAIRERLKATAEFQAEQMRQAAPYKLLFGIPETIKEMYGNQAAMNVLGARSVTDAYNQALQAYPNTQFASYQFQPQSYLR